MVKQHSIRSYVLAGGIAGMVARTCVAPIERIKIIYQVSNGNKSSSYFGIGPQIIRSQGVLGLWKGNGAAVIRVVPFMSITFLTYEETKIQLDKLHFLHQDAINIFSGSAAGVMAVMTTYPLDVVRARLALQLEGMIKTNYKGVSNALVTIWREEGTRALYKGMSTTVMGAAPYQGLKFGCYELLKRVVKRTLDVEEENLPGYFRVGCGALAGLLAQTCVYPFDVVRRRNQAHIGEGSRYSSALDAFRSIAREEGIKGGLYRGLTLNFLKSIPNVAIYMSLYDFLKLQIFT